jgi:hypothetical protein
LEDGRQGKTKETILKKIIYLLFNHIKSIESQKRRVTSQEKTEKMKSIDLKKDI